MSLPFVFSFVEEPGNSPFLPFFSQNSWKSQTQGERKLPRKQTRKRCVSGLLRAEKYSIIFPTRTCCRILFDYITLKCRWAKCSFEMHINSSSISFYCVVILTLLSFSSSSIFVSIFNPFNRLNVGLKRELVVGWLVAFFGQDREREEGSTIARIGSGMNFWAEKGVKNWLDQQENGDAALCST